MAGDKERLKRRIARLKARISELETAIREHVEAGECGWRSLGEAIGVNYEKKRLADGRAA